jgi:tetratricopeptide (TPR) repeat protein/predicted Ser/Thr protein kinase
MAIKCPKCLHENPNDTLFCGKCGTQFLSPKDADVTVTLETPKEELVRGTALADRYEIIEELGKGGMGRVYRVEDTKLNQEIALKLIKPEIARDKKIIERFRNELKTTRMIAHKNVCRMFDLGEAEGVHFITMEYVRGEDLKSMIRMSGQLGIGTAINIAKQVCEGLAESHRLGVLHRDLKPSNIMIDRDGNARIMDFGIARSLESEELTGTGVIIGTPKYVSPEQVEGKEIDQRSDIYSLGIILYEMVTGRVPFEGDMALSIAHKHRYEVPIEPKQINPQIPEDLNQVILKCLEKDRQKRFQSAEDVRDALHAIEQRMPAKEREVVDKTPTASKEITVTFALKKLRIPGLIATTLLIAAVIIWQVLKQGGESVPSESKPSIAVISFDNQTGEETYDRLKKIIPNLLITSLEQSGNFYVVTWERMYDLLKQSGHEDTENIDRELGFELCRLDNVDYIVLGSVTKLGDVFATDVKILDVQSKELLRSASARGKNESSILENQIDELSEKISQGVGLPEKRITTSTQKIADVTTSSLDAYNEFLKGVEKYDRYYYEEARKLFENAIERDPNFAAAHQWLALTYGKLGNTKARKEVLIQAKALAEKANEKDRLSIYALYAQVIEKDEEKRIRILEEMAVKFPREKRIHYNLGIHYWNKKEFSAAIDEYSKALALDPNYGSAWNGLGYTYADMGNYEKAIESFEKYAAVSPGDANPLDSLAEIHFQIGQLDSSIENYEKAVDARPDFFEAYWRVAYVYALKEEYRKALSWIERLIDRAPSPGIKAEAYLWDAFYHYWIGEADRSLRALRMASEQAERVDNKFGLAYSAWIEGWIDYDRGKIEKYRDLVRSWFELMLKHIQSYRPAPSEQLYSAEYSFFLGLSDLKQGQIDSARSRLKEMGSLMPKIDPVFRSRVADYDFKIFNAEVLLAQGSLDEAISVFDEEVLLEVPYMHSWLVLLYNTPRPRDVLARVYQKKGDLDRALSEYERLITFNPESKERRLIHPLYYYRLAKLYEETDRGEKAIEQYEKFLDLWKDADPRIAEVDAARKRLTGLKSQ